MFQVPGSVCTAHCTPRLEGAFLPVHGLFVQQQNRNE